MQTAFDAVPGFHNYKHLMAFNTGIQHMYKGTLVNGKPIKEDEVSVPPDGVLVGAKKLIQFKDQELITEVVEPAYLHVPKETDPLCVTYNEMGEKVKNSMNHKEVLDSEEWDVMGSILNQRYIEPDSA